MKKRHLKSVVAVCVAVALAVAGSGMGSGREQAVCAKESLANSPGWVAKLGKERNAKQLFVVAAVGQTTAYVSMHEKDESGQWKTILSTPGNIGKLGLGKQRVGDMKTPVGTFHFTDAFGIAKNPGCKGFKYKKVDDSDYWSGDERPGHHLNKMVSTDDDPTLNTKNCEHLIDYTVAYQYCMNISYNEEGTPGRGSAIFLHCLNECKPYTAGCVAIPREQMIQTLKNVRKDCVVVIDSLANISPETWKSWGF